MRLLVNILKGSDCTNGGISSLHERAILIYGENEEEINKHPPKNECVFILKKGLGSRKYMAKQLNDKRWLMFGGNFIYSSDSRFPSDQPIHIHDRYET